MENYKDTPELRDEYRYLMNAANKIAGNDSRAFNVFVEDEMNVLCMDKTPRNYVLAATSVVRFLALLENEDAIYRNLGF